jgi:lysyl-tRNA synthetase class 2
MSDDEVDAGADAGAMSKNALKKQKKAEEARLKKEAKEAAKAPAAAAAAAGGGAAAEVDLEDLDPSKYYENRLAQLDALVAEGKLSTLYPHKFQTTKTLPEFIKAYATTTKDGETLSDAEERVAGRVMLKRASGSKLFFYDLVQDGVKIQVMSQLQSWAGQDEASFALAHSIVRRGDIVGVWGQPGKSKKGAFLCVRCVGG